MNVLLIFLFITRDSQLRVYTKRKFKRIQIYCTRTMTRGVLVLTENDLNLEITIIFLFLSIEIF